jgi:tetratricopeptide (TPR) repeat protein
MPPSRHRFPLIVVFALLISSVALPQSNPTVQMPRLGTIRGQVRLSDGRSAPMGFAVYLEQRSGGTAGQTQTDRQGKFSFQQIPSDIYKVIVRAPGYVTSEQEVDLLTIMNNYVEFTLRPEPGSGSGPQPSAGTVSALDAKAPPEARKDLQDGQALLTTGKDIDKSIGLFKKATDEYPQYVQAYLMLGVAYSSQQKWDDAEKPLQKAIELDKTSVPSYIALGAVQNEKNNYTDAERNLKKAMQLSPDSADAHYELGRAYWGMSNWDGADAELSRSIQLRPNHSGEHLLRGNVLLRKRDAPGALAQFQEAVRLDPKGPFAEPTKQMIEKIQNALNSAKK